MHSLVHVIFGFKQIRSRFSAAIPEAQAKGICADGAASVSEFKKHFSSHIALDKYKRNGS